MTSNKVTNITILGSGRWATFHAWYQAEVLNNNVLLWGRSDEYFKTLQKERKNDFLTLPEDVKLTDNIENALNYSEYIIISISAQGIKELSKNISAHHPKNKVFILCMKGIHEETGKRLSEIVKSSIDKSNKVCVWVGPGHVQDFLSGQPNVMIIAADDKDIAKQVANEFSSSLIKLYINTDLIGVEVGAAAKNVLGIAAGMLDGARAPSLKGALMARGVYEISRLSTAMGGKSFTAYGLSHLGDFEATLFSSNSHNRIYGMELVRALEENRAPKNLGLAEGVATSKALVDLGKKYNVEIPICELVYKVLYEKKSPQDGFNELFARPCCEEYE